MGPRSIILYWADRDDPIACRCDPDPLAAQALKFMGDRRMPFLVVGGLHLYCTVGQLAAIRDVLDCWLCGEEPESYPATRPLMDVLEQELHDEECRRSAH